MIKKSHFYLHQETWCGYAIEGEKRDSHKLQPKFVGPYHVLEAYDNHTYKIERQGQSSVQNEVRLKLYHPCAAEPGRAPVDLEVRQRPNMKGALRQKRREETTEEPKVPLDFPPVPGPEAETTPESTTPETEPVTEPATEA